MSPAGSGRIAPAVAGQPDPPAPRLAVPRCARSCQVVPRTHRRTPPPAPRPARFEPTHCTLRCTLVGREIEIAPKWPFLGRSRGATRWVLQDSNHEPAIVPGCARPCQIVPMCATWRRLWRSARRAIVPGCARSCQVVTGAIAHSVAHSGRNRPRRQPDRLTRAEARPAAIAPKRARSSCSLLGMVGESPHGMPSSADSPHPSSPAAAREPKEAPTSRR
jgi:hypothetical protein